MDLQFWLTVAIVVISLIARANKKKAPQSPPPFNPSSGEDQAKPISFEDLLREIQSAKAPKTEPKPIPASSYETVDYDDNLEEESKSLEKADYTYADDKISETYERAKKEAFSRASLEETMHVEDTVVRFSQFKGYQQADQETQISTYLKDLQDPEGFKKAFIMSEILNRRF